jgi:hypothetical protein
MFRFLVLGVLLSFPLSAHAIDWAQPPVACVEEATHQEATFPCLDLTQVANPGLDFPPELTPEEKALWEGERHMALSLCRARETLRRERLAPGSMSAGSVELSWMRVLSVEGASEKIDSIYATADRHGMPPQLLLGALTQESMMSNLGIAADGGNYSCGIGQLNLREWCRWAESETHDTQDAIAWPRARIAAWKKSHGASSVCTESLAPPTLLKPFYEIGLARLGALPSYRLLEEHVSGIAQAEVEGGFPAGDAETQALRYLMANSFANRCSRHEFGIPGKATELAYLYKAYVPKALKARETYAPGERYARSCLKQPASRLYPLHSGWLLAITIYNAGPRARDILAHYRGIAKDQLELPETWAGLTPLSLVEALYWGGRYNPANDKIESVSLSGSTVSMDWRRQCILQRHATRVVKWVSLPGDAIIAPIEGSAGCKASLFNPDGTLLQSGVPLDRQQSKGSL